MDSFRIFADYAMRQPHLTKDQGIDLFKRYSEEGCIRSRDALLQDGYRLCVVHARRRAYNKQLDLMDLASEGIKGLFHALSKYDPEKGALFRTYAEPWVRTYVGRYIQKNRSVVRLNSSREALVIFGRIGKAMDALDALGIPLTNKNLADELSVPEKEVALVRMWLAPTGDQDKFKRTAVSPHEEPSCTADHLNVRKTLYDMVDRLPDEREKKILFEVHLSPDPKSYAGIAKELGLSRERVRQLSNAALSRLRQECPEELLQVYMDTV